MNPPRILVSWLGKENAFQGKSEGKGEGDAEFREVGSVRYAQTLYGSGQRIYTVTGQRCKVLKFWENRSKV